MSVIEPLVVVDDVHYRLPDGRWLLHGIDLDLRAGDRVAIMGPSGSGKSTLLAILGGVLRPTSGSVTRAHDLSTRDLMWLVQHTSILGCRSVRDNVALACFARGHRWSDAALDVTTALTLTGLDAVASTSAAAVSGGERQRIGVARALAARCRIVIADEPTASLDGRLVETIARALVDGAPSNTATVIATHDDRVAAACHNVWRLDGGALVAA